MSQTVLTVDPAVGFRGLIGDGARDKHIRSYANGAAAAQGFGILVKVDAANPEDQFDIFSGAGQKPLGVLVHQQPQQDPKLLGVTGVALLEVVGVMKRGRIWVPVEETIVATDRVFFRHTAFGGNTELGQFRKDAEGAAEVSTLTPNPIVNDVVYTVDIKIGLQDFHFETLSDGSATATEICDGIRAAMVLDAVFTALVVASGTTTLILTAQNVGEDLVITSTGEGLFDIVETTPPAPVADELPQSEWLVGSTGAGIALLDLILPS